MSIRLDEKEWDEDIGDPEPPTATVLRRLPLRHDYFTNTVADAEAYERRRALEDPRNEFDKDTP